MRKLLIKLVAIETALVGWLSYWLFLVYANNPSIAAELSSSLQRFPQTSFSTIDIAVLIIIAALAVTLAFRFQRGLRPGIRLERALQMLENLMKRNLVLEAQVAELKIEKSHSPPPPVITTSTVSPASPEPRQGSWEKAFRTPLEAGPPISKASAPGDGVPFSSETGLPPPRIEPKLPASSTVTQPPLVIGERGLTTSTPPAVIFDKPFDKASLQATPKPPTSVWEDSPQFVGESRGILTPSTSARRAPVVSDSSGLRQPYIPAPVPKVTTPSTITESSTPPVNMRTSNVSQSPRITARPTSRTPIARPPGITTTPQPVQDNIPKAETSAISDVPTAFNPSPVNSEPSNPTVNESDTAISRQKDQVPSSDEKTSTKQVQPTRRKISLDGS